MADVHFTFDIELHALELLGDATIDQIEALETSFTLAEAPVCIFTALLSDSFTLAGAHETPLDRSAELDTAFTLGSMMVSTSTTALVTPFLLSDEVVFSYTGLLSDTLIITESLTSTIEFLVEDAFLLTGAPSAVLTAALSATAEFSDDMAPSLVESATGIATFSDALVHYAVVTEILTGTVEFAGTETQGRSVAELLTGDFVLSDALDGAGSSFTTTLHATAVFDDALVASNFDAIAWVLNTESGGLTTYKNFDFRSLAFYEGKLYATSAFGVYELEGETDAGRRIPAHCTTGFLDFGTAYKKRLSDLYVGYTSDGTLECDVETYDGPQDVYTYDMQERSADAPRNSRVKLGRGLSSRYWRFTIRNTDGADFQVYDLAVEMGKSKNRRL